MARRDDDYRFLKIRDATAAINQKVNLMGVVVEFSLPKKSKGTDCFCRLKIVDESCQGPGISVNVFAENMEKLPRIESDGDIIQFFHVVVAPPSTSFRIFSIILLTSNISISLLDN
ncbi:protection of telomeres protein 1c [Macadamia integrifolia]|uniref:protection of telomeres protein 1c n=1 Tax=Macadamia integrifolia TaxID=60698 RepID=UPI001C4EAD29|nr:protection of telomeres protein 1c [Macadamia integrifolia]